MPPMLQDGLILPLRDHGYAEEGLGVNHRAVPFGVCVTRRRTGVGELGHYEEDPKRRGDLGGWHHWPAIKGRRPSGAWSAAWPAIATVAAGGGTGAGGPITVQPIWDRTYVADERFEPLDVQLPANAPAVAPGTFGVVLPGTKEDSHETVFIPGGGQLIAVNFYPQPDPGLSTIVFDLDPESRLDKTRNARIHTAWRVCRPMKAAWDAQPYWSGHPALAWQLGHSGTPPNWSTWAYRDQGLGLCVTTEREGVAGSGEDDLHATSGVGPYPVAGQIATQDTGQAIYAAFSRTAGGPLDCGDLVCPHRINYTEDNEPILAGHLQTRSLFRGHGGDGPLDFENTLYSHPPPWPFRSRVFLRYDPAKPYKFLDRTLFGVWRWEAEFDKYIPDDGPPITGGGDATAKPAGGDGAPPAPSGIPTGFPAGTFRRQRAVNDGHEPYAASTVPSATASEATQASNAWNRDIEDVRKVIQSKDATRFAAWAPIVQRREGFGQVASDGRPVHTETPSQGRYRAGTSVGGTVTTPPEVDLEDVRQTTYTAPSLVSTTRSIYVPGARRSWGLPDVDTGGVRQGWDMYVDNATAAHLRIEPTADNTTGVIMLGTANVSGGPAAITGVISTPDASGYVLVGGNGTDLELRTGAGGGAGGIGGTIFLNPGSGGSVKFGTHTALGAETVTGYITIIDAGGTTRKVAVVS